MKLKNNSRMTPVMMTSLSSMSVIAFGYALSNSISVKWFRGRLRDEMFTWAIYSNILGLADFINCDKLNQNSDLTKDLTHETIARNSIIVRDSINMSLKNSNLMMFQRHIKLNDFGGIEFPFILLLY